MRVGKTPGIYTSWDECSQQVNKFPGAKYKSFTSRDEAEDFVGSAVKPKTVVKTDPINIKSSKANRKRVKNTVKSDSTNITTTKRARVDDVGGNTQSRPRRKKTKLLSTVDLIDLTEDKKDSAEQKHNESVELPKCPGALELFFDGGSRGNPGVAGAGAVLYSTSSANTKGEARPRPRIVWEGSKFCGESETNNFAEYAGLLLGLEESLYQISADPDSVATAGFDKLTVYGDSLLIINQMTGKWRCKHKGLQELHGKCKRASLSLFALGVCLEWNQVPRAKNKRADALANRAMDTMKDMCQRVPRRPV